MGGKDGGTKKWCPYCKRVTICSALPIKGQRFHKSEHTDIQFFRRKLECNTCYKTWFSAEVEEKFLGELTELRNNLSKVKSDTEHYLNKSKKATEALENLSETLNTLTALKIYKDQG